MRWVMTLLLLASLSLAHCNVFCAEGFGETGACKYYYQRKSDREYKEDCRRSQIMLYLMINDERCYALAGVEQTECLEDNERFRKQFLLQYFMCPNVM